MSLSIAIVGLPNVGKSTLFNALTDSHVLAANYPFATIEPNTGIVPVPDPRLQKLSELYGNAPVKPATVTFVDIAGLVKGASEGEGLGNQFLSHIRACNAIVQVVRAFDDPNIVTDDATGQHDPARDIETINTELVLADLQTVTKRLPRLEKESRANPKLKPEYDTLQHVHDLLDGGQPVWSQPDIDLAPLTDLFLLTAKPVIYVFNVDEEGLRDTQKIADLSSVVAPSPSIFISAKLEDELRALDTDDAKELLESYGFTELGLAQLITLGIRHTRLAELSNRWRKRSPGLDYSQRSHSPTGSRCHPWGL